MKKLLSIMLVLTMALTLLAGCGGSGSSSRRRQAPGLQAVLLLLPAGAREIMPGPDAEGCRDRDSLRYRDLGRRSSRRLKQKLAPPWSSRWTKTWRMLSTPR